MTAASATSDREGRGRIADIELLRAIAVMFTIIEHLNINIINWPSAIAETFYSYFHFWGGVDLFFAISGFVIARGLIPKLDRCTNRVEFVNETVVFWVRRAWRLLPSAWLWLGFILIASLTFNRAGTFGSFRTNFEGAVAAVLDVANFRVMETYGRITYGASSSYWSLSLEEQFYLLFPAAIFLCGRRLPVVLAIGVLLQLFLDRSRSLLLMELRCDALMLGVLLALWTRHPTHRLFEPVFLRRSAMARWSILCLLFLGLAAVSSDESHIAWFRVGLVALISAALVLIASYDADYLMRDGALKRVLLWVGSRSYAIYLIHLPAMFLVREIWFRLALQPVHGRGWILIGAPILLTLVLAELNYRWVERPLRIRGARLADALAARVRSPEGAMHEPA